MARERARPPFLVSDVGGVGSLAAQHRQKLAADALDVAELDDALLEITGNRRRSIPLPRKLAALALVGAKLDAGQLVVRLAQPSEAG